MKAIQFIVKGGTDITLTVSLYTSVLVFVEVQALLLLGGPRVHCWVDQDDAQSSE